MSPTEMTKIASPLQTWAQIFRDNHVTADEISLLEQSLARDAAFTLSDARMIELGGELLAKKSSWREHALPPLTASAVDLTERRNKIVEDAGLTLIAGASIGWAGTKIGNPMLFLLVGGLSWLVIADGLASMATGLPPIMGPEEYLELANMMTGK